VIDPFLALSLLWLAWVVSWAVASRWTAATVSRESGLSRLGYGVFWWAGATLLFARPGRWGPLSRSVFPASGWTTWSGVALCVAGFAFTWWARVVLGKFWSSSVTLKADHALVREGPYALTRHPIYTGLLLAVIGTALTRDSLGGLLGVAVLVVGMAVKIRKEERLLLGHFGAAYEAYRAEVPALVPRIG
jgi:protein-S-isoprenylcysteine O-methyltransferase Ste14